MSSTAQTLRVQASIACSIKGLVATWLPQIKEIPPSIHSSEGWGQGDPLPPDLKGNDHLATESASNLRQRRAGAPPDRSKSDSNTQPPAPNKLYSAADRHMSNIIIFGATGVGKSSVVNLIAGQTLAHTSNKALGCTFHHQPYDIVLGDVRCRLWDTAGLDEGTEGTVPAFQAERNLKTFIQRMAHAGGVNLLIYCIRGARLTKDLRSNYDIFYSGVCRKKVPIALVITGLENEKKGMEAWWETNEKTLRAHGMRFDAHACVTTLDLDDEDGKERQLRSQERLRDLIVTYSNLSPWKIEESFISQIFPVFRSLIRATPSPDEPPARRVIVCDMVAPSIQFLPGITSPCLRCLGLIGDQQYEFIYTDKYLMPPPDKGGLLIFYTSPLVNSEIPREDVDKLKKFYDIAGGLTSPMIVVLRGCYEKSVALACWDAISCSLRDVYAYPIFLSDEADHRPITELVERLWIDPVPLGSDSSKLPGRG